MSNTVRFKKIGIVHYRVGRTDGVSLEIEKRKALLANLGYEVRLISGPVQEGADIVIDELEFDTPEISEIKENSFRFFGRSSLNESALMQRIENIAARIEEAFLACHAREKFDALLVHNIFSHGRHIAAASAFVRITEKLGIPVLATNHDYYWERDEYQKPATRSIEEYLASNVPPKLANVTLVSINSLAAAALLERRGLKSLVFPDVFDFGQKPWMQDDYNRDFLASIGVKPTDLVILQATRIVRRKGIEIAIDFVRELASRKSRIEGIELYNGKVLKQDSEIVFVLAGYAEQSDRDYLGQLKQKVKETGIEARFIDSHIAAHRSREGRKVYSLWDAYVFADFVTYPSLYEGWGNQFIEAIFARKPVALFEYPVFEADIKGEDYDYVSFGNVAHPEHTGGLVSIPHAKMRSAVEQTLAMLTAHDTSHSLERNFRIGDRNHGYSVLERFLVEHLLSQDA